MDQQRIRTKLRNARMEKGLSQQDIANRLEISKSYLGYLELGQRKGDVELLRKWAEALGFEFKIIIK